MAYATEQERRLLVALERLLALTDDDSLVDQKADPRLREEFRQAREFADDAASAARKILRLGTYNGPR